MAITPDFFRELHHCSPDIGLETSRVARELGGLARWWLTPEALASAREETASERERVAWQPGRSADHLGATAGTCHLLYAAEAGGLGAAPMLRSGRLLPTRWVSSREAEGRHDPRLPRGLRDTAEQVHAVFSDQRSLRSRWWLVLQPEMGDLDLSRLSMPSVSVWPALAIGLLVADRGGRSRPDVWATGEWNGSGFKAVCLPDKLRLAASAGVSRVYVPEVQRQEAQELVQREQMALELAWLPETDKDAESVLRGLRQDFQVEPVAGDPPKVRLDWLQTLPNRHAQTSFYQRAFRSEVIKQLRKQRAERTDLADITHLVACVSGSFPFEVPSVTLGVTTVILLHSTDDSTCERLKEGKKAIKELAVGSTPKIQSFAFEQSIDQAETMADVLRDCLAGVKPEKIAFEATGGTSDMKLDLILRVAPRGSRLVTTVVEYAEDRLLNLPLTERWRVWVAPGPEQSAAG